MKKVKFFTIDSNYNQTLESGAPTWYEINNFLNSGIKPTDISAEYNEFSGKILVSIGYGEEKSNLDKVIDRLKGRKRYVVRFESLAVYNEDSHTVYIQKMLEDAINYNQHDTISHGIFVDKGRAKVVFLEALKD